MKQRVIATVLVLLLAVPTIVTGQTLQSAAIREASKVATQPAQVGPNPYKIPAIALMAGGAGLLILGLAQERGVRAEGDIFNDTFEVKETGGSKTALTVLGVLAAGSGVGLWFWGEGKKNRPNISMTPTKVQIGFRF